MLKQMQEKALGQIPCLFRIVTPAPDICVQGIPVDSVEFTERRLEPAPSSGPRAALRSTESYEIGMGPPRAKFGPASSVNPKQHHVMRFNPDFELNLLPSRLGKVSDPVHGGKPSF